MTDGQDPSAEMQELEGRLLSSGLTPEEQERLDALRDAVAREGKEPTGVLWEQGPVEQPAGPAAAEPALAPLEPLPAPAAVEAVETAEVVEIEEPGGIPPPDPAFDAVVVAEPEEAVPEVSADDVEEIVEEAPPPLERPEVAVGLVDEEETGEVVSLESLLASPPPSAAASLAPPLPPPMPPPAPAAAPSPLPSPVPEPAAAAIPGPAERDPFAPSYSFVSGDHRIVLHTLEGQVLRGSLANADLCDPELPLIQPNGAVARVPADHVKAIFFMLTPGDRPPAAAGTRVRVTFGDGRQVSGLSPDYAPDSPGFFVLPLDIRTNTARVWVYRAAARQIAVG